ncbi:unnamed protein product, partial [Phaeothamnion confervicola]
MLSPQAIKSCLLEDIGKGVPSAQSLPPVFDRNLMHMNYRLRKLSKAICCKSLGIGLIGARSWERSCRACPSLSLSLCGFISVRPGDQLLVCAHAAELRRERSCR